MKKSAFLFLLSFSFGAFAADSCQVAINTDDMGLSVLEKAKLELQLKKKDYELAYKMKIHSGLGSVGNGFGFIEKLVFMDHIKLSDQLSDKGEPQFEISRQKVASLPDLEGAYKVDIEKTIKPASEVEIVLKDMNYDVRKILKPKRRLFGLRRDEGSAGYKLLAGLIRDLPKCDNKDSVDDSDRVSGKETPSSNNFSGFNAGTTVFGY